MELDKKALAVTRLVAAIYRWEPRGRARYSPEAAKKRAVKALIDDVLPTKEAKNKVVNMILAMTLLTSAHVESVRNPEVFDEKRAERWPSVLSEPAEETLKALGFPYYDKIKKEDYVMAKKLLPVIGSSSMLEAEVMKIFKSAAAGQYKNEIEQYFQKDQEEKRGLGGYEFLYRGLGDMSDNALILLTTPGIEWDMERGVSTSRDYRTAKGFSQKHGANEIFFTLINPKRKGFNALQLSKFPTEDEVILSGKIKIERFQLTINAEVEGGGPFANPCTIEFGNLQGEDDTLFMIRQGSQIIFGKKPGSKMSQEEILNIVHPLLKGETVSITTFRGREIKLKLMKKSGKIEVVGTIL